MSERRKGGREKSQEERIKKTQNKALQGGTAEEHWAAEKPRQLSDLKDAERAVVNSETIRTWSQTRIKKWLENTPGLPPQVKPPVRPPFSNLRLISKSSTFESYFVLILLFNQYKSAFSFEVVSERGFFETFQTVFKNF